MKKMLIDQVNIIDSMIEKYQMIFDDSPIGICISEKDGSINMNNTFCEMLGYTKDELLEASWKDILFNDDTDNYHDFFDFYSNDADSTKKFEKRFIKKDGTVIWTEITSQLKNNDNETPAFIITLIRDISELKNIQEKLKQNENRFKELFENNPNPMWLYDIQTLKFLMINDAAVSQYGYTRAELLNMTLKDISSSEDLTGIINYSLNPLGSTIQESSTWQHRRKDGSVILVKISSHSIRLNGYTATFMMAIDVTEKIVTKKNLIDEAAKLKSIIESTSDIIFSVDTNYCYTIFNTAHSIMMKNLYNADIEIGKSILDCQSADVDMQKTKFNIDKALNNEKVQEISISGEESLTQKYFEVMHNPIKNENGDVIGVSVFAKDITDKKIAFDKVKQLSKAVEQSPVTIIVTDTDGNIQYINKRGVDVTGFSLDEILGKNPRILSSGEMKKETYKELWDNIKSGNEWRGELHNKKKNGDLYWESASICPIINEKGEITNFLAVKEDITDRKKTEKELIAAKEKAEEINKIKSSFLSNMSHELRTPLAGILGFADILTETLTGETEKAMAESILQAGKRLLNTLTSLLSLSELETNKPQIEQKITDVNAICFDVINFYKVNSKKQNIKFKTEFETPKLKLKINFELLREALDNIVKNSVTYTESGSITIKTYTRLEPVTKNSSGVIEVIDTGIGIPKEKLKIIFEEFRQASEGLTRNFDGIGLGLTLSKKYLELMNAAVNVESEVGKGTKFIISFPNVTETITETSGKKQVDKTVTEKSNLIKMNNSTIKDKRILLVEDDHVQQLFLKKCFSNLCEFVVVSTGEQAIKISTEHRFDLILMDINLGRGMAGTTVAQMIRKFYGHENTAIVAMTAFASNEDKKKFLLEGFSYYISKPFYKHQIIQLVNEILSEKKIN